MSSSTRRRRLRTYGCTDKTASQIARELGVNERTARNIVQRCEDDGFVEAKKRGRKRQEPERKAADEEVRRTFFANYMAPKNAHKTLSSICGESNIDIVVAKTLLVERWMSCSLCACLESTCSGWRADWRQLLCPLRFAAAERQWRKLFFTKLQAEVGREKLRRLAQDGYLTTGRCVCFFSHPIATISWSPSNVLQGFC